MPRSAMQAMIDAVPSSLMSDLRADALKPNPVTGGAAPQPQQTQRGSGWIDERPLGPPPGISIIDEMCEAADQRERRER